MTTMKPNHYWCELWRENYYFFLGWPPKEFEDYIYKNLGHTIECGRSNGKCMELIGAETTGQYIWVRPKSGINLHTTLIHECIHAAMNTLYRRGIYFTLDNQEPLTYLVELIFRKAMDGQARKLAV